MKKLIELVKEENMMNMEKAILRLEKSEYKETALKNALTETRWIQYQKTGDRKTAVEFAKKRLAKQYGKNLEKKINRIRIAESADNVTEIAINIIWKRSRTWGYNPHVNVRIFTDTMVKEFSGTASGCGYDKESAGIADALNKSNELLKALYNAKEKALENGWKNESDCSSNATCIAYGAGYGAIPYFEGGVGFSSLEAVLNKCGFTLNHRNHTKTTDYYYFKRA